MKTKYCIYYVNDEQEGFTHTKYRSTRNYFCNDISYDKAFASIDSCIKSFTNGFIKVDERWIIDDAETNGTKYYLCAVTEISVRVLCGIDIKDLCIASYYCNEDGYVRYNHKVKGFVNFKYNPKSFVPIKLTDDEINDLFWEIWSRI